MACGYMGLYMGYLWIYRGPSLSVRRSGIFGGSGNMGLGFRVSGSGVKGLGVKGLGVKGLGG